ncbi:MAG: hypothetical protein ACKOGA_00440, partial [Planctomycetaceae bacterium]
RAVAGRNRGQWHRQDDGHSTHTLRPELRTWPARCLGQRLNLARQRDLRSHASRILSPPSCA